MGKGVESAKEEALDGVQQCQAVGEKVGGTPYPASEDAGPTGLAPGPEYPKGVNLAIIVGSLAVSVFLCALDETIIATAIPKITDEFGSLDDIGWYGPAYFMTFASFQLIYGKLFSFYPIKYVFLWSVVLFEVGSLICATAPTSSTLIVGRACAGVGSAGINAGFIIILAASLPLHRRPIFVASYSGTYGVASIVAPLLGGAFTTHYTWRWCFYINLPIGAIAIAAMAYFLRPPRRANRKSTTWREKVGQMDLLGTAVLVPAITCLLLGLQRGGSGHGWTATSVIVLLVAAGCSLTAFVGIQIWKQDEASMPPRILKQRSVASSAIYVFCAGGALNIFQYFLPIWFQAIQGVTAFDSGSRILPTTLGTVLFSLVAGFGVAKTGYYAPFMILGASLLLIGTAMSTTWEVSSPASQWLGYQIVVGAGAGLGIQQAHTAAQTVLSGSDVPTGAVILIFSQVLGGTVWLSVAQSVLMSQLLSGLIAEFPQLDPAIVLEMGATGLRDGLGSQGLPIGGVLGVYNFSLTGTFICAVALSAGAFMASFAIEWRSIKPRKSGTQPQIDTN